MRYLKERIIQHLLTYPDTLDMEVYMAPYSRLLCKHDLSGHILRAAGYHLQVGEDTRQPKLPLNAPLLDKKWVDFELQLGGCKGYIDVPALARQIWEEEYGEREAQELPFYDESVDAMPMLRYWDSLGSVNASDVIEFLQGDMAIYKLNGPNDEEEDD